MWGSLYNVGRGGGRFPPDTVRSGRGEFGERPASADKLTSGVPGIRINDCCRRRAPRRCDNASTAADRAMEAW
jgi:hypothetical protein